jgi:hypothetical protein
VEDEHLTHEAIAERVFEQTGTKPARSTVSVALVRAGLAEPRYRFKDEIPWRLRGNDLKAYPVRMLRLLGHRRRGSELNDEENRRLDNWLAMLEEENAVVAHDPDVTPSVFYIDKGPEDGLDGIPIRRRRVFVNPRR